MVGYGDWGWGQVSVGIGVVWCIGSQVVMVDVVVVCSIEVVDYGWVGLQVYVDFQVVYEYVGDLWVFVGQCGFFFDD